MKKTTFIEKLVKMHPVDRLVEYFLKKGKRSYTDIEQYLGLSRGALSAAGKRKGGFSSETMVSIVTHCKDINVRWLLSGEGEMYNEWYIEHHKLLEESLKLNTDLHLNEEQALYISKIKVEYDTLQRKYYELLEKYNALLESQSENFQKTGTEN